MSWVKSSSIGQPSRPATTTDSSPRTHVTLRMTYPSLLSLGTDRGSRSTWGVPTFEVELTREGADEGVDVTDEMHAILADRFAELLAIVGPSQSRRSDARGNK